MFELRTVEDLRPADYNPRTINEDALRGLGRSLEEFGDISGIVWNQRSGNMVCGHQRLNALQERYAGALRLIHEDGRVSLMAPSGELFEIRVVDWADALEKAANLAANNPHISGDFTPDAVMLIEEVKLELPELSIDLQLDILGEQLGDFSAEAVGMPELSSEERAGFQQMTFILTDEQVEVVQSAMEAAIREGPFEDTGNKNSHGNALARLAAAYCVDAGL